MGWGDNWNSDGANKAVDNALKEPLVDGVFGARVVDVRWAEGFSKKSGKEYAAINLSCYVEDGPNRGRTVEVGAVVIEGDEASTGRFRKFLALLGYGRIAAGDVQGVLQDPIAGPKGKTVRLKAKTGDDGRQFVNLVSLGNGQDGEEAKAEARTPSAAAFAAVAGDKPKVPVDDFPF